MKNNLKTLFVLFMILNFFHNIFSMSEYEIENSAKMLVSGIIKPRDFNLEDNELINHVKYALSTIRDRLRDLRNMHTSKRNEQTDEDSNGKLCLELLSKPDTLRFTLSFDENSFFIDYNPANKTMLLSTPDNKCSDKCCRVS